MTLMVTQAWCVTNNALYTVSFVTLYIYQQYRIISPVPTHLYFNSSITLYIYQSISWRFVTINRELKKWRRSYDDAVGPSHKVKSPSSERLNLRFSGATARFGGARPQISRLFLVRQWWILVPESHGQYFVFLVKKNT